MKLNLDTGRRYRDEITSAIHRVIESESYIRGPEWKAFNTEFADAVGVEHAIGVASGTDGLFLTLKAWGIGPGDEVITTAHCVAFTALAIHATGATPVFADVDEETLTLDPAAFEGAITAHTKAVVPVHLYGHMADMDTITAIASHHGIKVLEDACHAVLATQFESPAGTWGDAAVFSFYPTKNLGGMGDGGAIVTDDERLAELLRKLSDGGRCDRYEHDLCGINSSLDDMQAAILRVRLKYLMDDTITRRMHAHYYDEHITTVARPVEKMGYRHVYHLYVVRTDHRDKLMENLHKANIPALIHYPIPVHRQPCFAYLGYEEGRFPVAEAAAKSVLSIPLHPELTEVDRQDVVRIVEDWR